VPSTIAAENGMRTLALVYLGRNQKAYLSVLENHSARVRNCEKETSPTKWKAAISSLLILGSFLAEFLFPTAIKNRLTPEETGEL
jgi:hypothetical protein